MEGVVENYWPTYRLLTPEAKDSFRVATRLLFDSTIGEYAWTNAAMAAGRSVELQLRSTVFEPFADAARKATSSTVRASAPGARPEPLVAFLERGSTSPLTMGAMVNYLLSTVNPKEGVERRLRDWLKVHRPKLASAVRYGKLNATVDIGELRNRATHASISQAEAGSLYKACRDWLDELTRDK
jgi:hypothetical protein